MGLLVDIKAKLDNFDMKISFETKAKRIGILGASGAGKSMMLKYISGIITPDEGVIVLNGETIYNSSKKINVRPQKRNVAYMFQNYALFPNMSVRENIEIIVNGGKDFKRKKASELMEKFCIANLADKKPKDLSGGQQQRVALARIMAYEPKVILLDEPFSALDNDLKEKLQIELEDMIADYDGMVIMVSHSRDEIYRFSEELIIIDNGSVVEHGMTKEIFRSPKTIHGAKLVGISNILPAYIDEESVIQIPDFETGIDKNTLEEFSKDRVKYIGIRETDFDILSADEEAEHFIDAKVESIYEGMEFTKVYFSVKESAEKKYDESEKIYCLRLNNTQDIDKISENSSLRLAIDKDKIVYIEE